MLVSAPGGRGRKRKDAAKSAEFVTTDDEAGEASEVEGIMANGDAERPAPRKRRGRAAQNGAMSEGELGATEDEAGPAAASTPKARPKPRAVRKRGPAKKTSPSKSPSKSPSPSPANPRDSRSLTPLSSVRDSVPPEEAEEEAPAPETPKASRKRGREDDDEEPSDEEMPDVATNGVEHEDEDESPVNASQQTQASEIKIRRKRVRH